MSLKQRQQQLMAYILGNGDEIAEHIQGDDRALAGLRLHIYRNNYQAGLRGVLESDFEMLGLYLGDTLFEQMVTGYLAAYPSKYKSLRDFGTQLPEFLRTHPPFNEHPQLAELARFERLLLRAFDAADAPRAQVDDLLALAHDQWPELKLRFHPSVQVFSAQWNVVPIWQALKAQQAPPQATAEISVWVLWRNAERLTEFGSVDSLEARCLSAFMSGNSLSEVAEQLLDHQTEEALTQWLVETLMRWLQQGWIRQLVTAQDCVSLRVLSSD